jgi:hypothetical protein
VIKGRGDAEFPPLPRTQGWGSLRKVNKKEKAGPDCPTINQDGRAH